MSAPTRRAGVIAFVVLALVAAGLATAWYLRGHRPGDDCANFRTMNSYNKDFQADLDRDLQANADRNDSEQYYAAVRTDKYKTWAAHMRDYANRFNDPPRSARHHPEHGQRQHEPAHQILADPAAPRDDTVLRHQPPSSSPEIRSPGATATATCAVAIGVSRSAVMVSRLCRSASRCSDARPRRSAATRNAFAQHRFDPVEQLRVGWVAVPPHLQGVSEVERVDRQPHGVLGRGLPHPHRSGSGA